MKIIIILGTLLMGFLLPEFLQIISKNKVNIPLNMNIVSAVGCGLIVAGILFL